MVERLHLICDSFLIYLEMNGRLGSSSRHIEFRFYRAAFEFPAGSCIFPSRPSVPSVRDRFIRKQIAVVAAYLPFSIGRHISRGLSVPRKDPDFPYMFFARSFPRLKYGILRLRDSIRAGGATRNHVGPR